jgi:nucleoside 2-deoxyribosyltransferase
MKIYLASSWKNETLVFVMAKSLRKAGHEVDAFCEIGPQGRSVFKFTDHLLKMNAFDAFKDKRIKQAFEEDRKWLDWCDCCILILPSGKSSHLEAGYAKGQGKKLIIYHAKGFPAGEIDVMYNFADLLTEELEEIRTFLKNP